MSSFTRAQDAWLTPPDAPDPHPWSKELWALLEDAKVEDSVITQIVAKFDEALGDRFHPLTVEDLLNVACSCEEVNVKSATFWHNKRGGVDEVTGEDAIDTLLSVANIMYNQDGPTQESEAYEIMRTVLPVEGSTIEAALNIFGRVKRIHFFTTPAREIYPSVEEPKSSRQKEEEQRELRHPTPK